MRKQSLMLHNTLDGDLRCVIKNNHGRVIYLKLSSTAGRFNVKECYYLDRKRGSKHYATPKKLVTTEFKHNEILNVVATQLDRLYYEVAVVDSLSEMSDDEFIEYKLNTFKRGYKFLIFVGEGEMINGIPSVIKTRFKNQIHRSIYLEIRYSNNGKGIVANCHYYDRTYKERSVVIPEMLSTVYFLYNRQVILNIVNNELNGSFTDIIFITDNSINIENKVPLCGNI